MKRFYDCELCGLRYYTLQDSVLCCGISPKMLEPYQEHLLIENDRHLMPTNTDVADLLEDI